jgi:hypothetical protein
MKALPLVAAGVLAVGLTACSGGDAVTDETGQAEEAAADTTGGDGELLAVGAEMTVADWTVSLDATDTAATEAILAADELAEAPIEGRDYILVTVTATYQGADTGAPWADLWLSYSGADGTVYDPIEDVDSACPYLEDGLDGLDDVASGTEVAGLVCASVPTEQIEGGHWIVSDLFDEYTYNVDIA